MIVEFPTVPPVGTILKLDEQVYSLLAVEDYTRKDGTASKLLSWSTRCPVCGDAFEIKTGLKARDVVRRCPAHRDPKLLVSGQKRGRGRKVKITIIDPALAVSA